VSDIPIPEAVLSLIRAAITSVWALELLLFLKANQTSAWTVPQLVRELRGSSPLVADLLVSLHRSGLVAQEEEAYRYGPANDELQELVEQLERLSAERPFAVRNAILAAPHDRVQVFADAFRIKRS
jgi:predicted transcriptional regulator